MVRIREPLTAQQLETTTERWLVIDHVPTAVPTVSPCLSSPSPLGRARVRDSGLIGLTLPKQVTGPKAKVPLIPASSREAGNRSVWAVPHGSPSSLCSLHQAPWTHLTQPCLTPFSWGTQFTSLQLIFKTFCDLSIVNISSLLSSLLSFLLSLSLTDVPCLPLLSAGLTGRPQNLQYQVYPSWSLDVLRPEIPIAPPILCLCPLTLPLEPHHFLCSPSSPLYPADQHGPCIALVCWPLTKSG